MKALARLLADEKGATVAEYAIIAGIITFSTIAAIISLGFKVMTMFAVH